MLDVALRSDLVNPVARTPGAMGVSFLVPRAYAPDALWSKPVIASARTLGKPTNPAEMIDASKAILG